jgi:GTP1/Obg family GTP-binding protein
MDRLWSLKRAFLTGDGQVMDTPGGLLVNQVKYLMWQVMDTPGLLVKQVKYLMWQVMDTPGLLPRGDAARNEMELLTLASMQVACAIKALLRLY